MSTIKQELVKQETIINRVTTGSCLIDNEGKMNYLDQKDITPTITQGRFTYHYHGTSDGRAYYSLDSPSELKDKMNKYSK